MSTRHSSKMLVRFLLAVVIATTCSCAIDKNPFNYDECYPKNITSEFLGFEDKLPLCMVLADPYLYVCAGSDGVWKRDLKSMSKWQYLGLGDTSLGKYTYHGAREIDVIGEDVLVAYNGAAPNVESESTISVWRSTNGGMDWFRSDSGIPETIPYPYDNNVLTSLERSPHKPNIVIGWIDPTSYRSMDGGSHWIMLFGQRGVVSGDGIVRWHPFQPGEVWIFGSAALFYPYCFSMQNYGSEPKASINFDSLGFPADGDVYDVAFDAGNPDIVYAATSQGVIKTSDGGYTWRNNAVQIPDNGFVLRMAHHSSIGGILYLAGGKRIYSTCDGGKTVHLIGEIKQSFITSFVLDTQGNQLFVGASEGGIYALKLNGR